MAESVKKRKDSLSRQFENYLKEKSFSLQKIETRRVALDAIVQHFKEYFIGTVRDEAAFLLPVPVKTPWDISEVAVVKFLHRPTIEHYPGVDLETFLMMFAANLAVVAMQDFVRRAVACAAFADFALQQRLKALGKRSQEELTDDDRKVIEI